MRGKKAIKRYAKSLFLAAGLDNTEKVINDLSVLNDLLEKNSDIRSVLVNPRFEEKDRDAAIRLIAEKLKFSEITGKFIYRLAEDSEFSALTEIIRVLIDYYLYAKKRSRVTVITPVKPSSIIENRLKKTLKSTLDRDIELDYVTDQALIGGLIVKVGSTMYDFSVRGQLRLLREELLTGG